MIFRVVKNEHLVYFYPSACCHKGIRSVSAHLLFPAPHPGHVVRLVLLLPPLQVGPHALLALLITAAIGGGGGGGHGIAYVAMYVLRSIVDANILSLLQEIMQQGQVTSGE
jgi:hypothetical protein